MNELNDWGRLRLLPGLLTGLAALIVCQGLDARLEPRPGEPLALRWARAAADHPVRTPLAFWLLVTAFLPRRPPKPDTSLGKTILTLYTGGVDRSESRSRQPSQDR